MSVSTTQPKKITMIHPKVMLTIGFYSEYQKKILNEYKYDNKIIEAYAFYESSSTLCLRFEDFSFDIKTNPQNTGRIFNMKGLIAHYSTIDSFNALSNIAEVCDNAKAQGSNFILFIFGCLKTFVFQYKFLYVNNNIDYQIKKLSTQLTIEDPAVKEAYQKHQDSSEINIPSWVKISNDVYAINDISPDQSSIPIFIKNALKAFTSIDHDPSKEKVLILNKQNNSLLQLTVANIKHSDQTSLRDSYEKEEIIKVDLKRMLNPESIAASAIDLNINLMKWRMSPDLDTEIIRKSNYLLIGAGTLGCHVARCLLGWGARNITFIDNGRVSYSNPVRQSLYTFSDSTTENYKAILGAQKLKEIFPLANAQGFNFQIPLPGRTLVNDQAKTAYFDSLKLLQEQIAKCDVMFLLTDSRESRWYPTVIAKALNKQVITAAIGFDSYLVMRHGTTQDNLGCYFCTDIIKPSDSSGSRTLDQQCTISRPGVSMICSGLAIELAMTVMNKGLGKDDYSTPHQLRGNLLDYTMQHFHHFANKNCVACSDNITEQFKNNYESFALNVMNDQYYIEKTCGIDELIKNINFDITEEKDDF